MAEIPRGELHRERVFKHHSPHALGCIALDLTQSLETCFMESANASIGCIVAGYGGIG